MAELAAHLPLSLPSLTAGVYFFPVSTSAKVAPGRLAYGAPIRVADPVGVWAIETPAAAASPAACRPADIRDAADDRVARRCDGAAPGGLLVSMKDSGIAFACYCRAGEDAAAADQEEDGLMAAADQRGWNKRGDDDAQRGWNKRGDDDSTEQMTTTGVQRGWNKRGDDDAQRGWNKRGDDDAQRGWNKRSSEDDGTEQMTATGVQRGWNKRHADDQRGWNRLSIADRISSSPAAAEPQPEARADAASVLQPEDQRGWNKRADAAALQPEDQRGWNKRADTAALQPEDQRGWNKRSSGADKPVQATGVQRGWNRRAMAQRGML